MTARPSLHLCLILAGASLGLAGCPNPAPEVPDGGTPGDAGTNDGGDAGTNDGGDAGTSDGGDAGTSDMGDGGAMDDAGTSDGGDAGTSDSGDGGPASAHVWSVRFGDPNIDTAVDLASSNVTGDLFATGRFSNDITFGTDVLTSPGGTYAYLAALDDNGATKWGRSLGDVFAEDLTTDSAGNVVVAARAFSTINWGPTPADEIPCCQQLVVGKFAPDGSHIFSQGWSDFLPIAAQRTPAVAVDSSDAIYIAFTFDRDFTVGGFALEVDDGEDMWVMKLGSNGNVEWATSFGGSDDENPTGIALDDAGNIYVTGVFGGSITVGATSVTASTDDSLFLAKLSNAGAPLDVVGFDTTLFGDVTLVADGDGVLLGGGYDIALDLGAGALPHGGDADAFVARFTDQLVVDWAHAFGMGLSQSVSDLGRDAQGDLWLTGTAAGSIDFGPGLTTAVGNDMFLVRLDGTTHTVNFATLFGGPGDQQGAGLGFGPLGGVVLFGDGAGSVDFGGGPLMSAGRDDIYFVKIDLSRLD